MNIARSLDGILRTVSQSLCISTWYLTDAWTEYLDNHTIYVTQQFFKYSKSEHDY